MAGSILQNNFIPDVDPDFKPTQQAPQHNGMPWPSVFPKPVVGIERKNIITSGRSITLIDGALEAIYHMRIKGYKVLMINDERGVDPTTTDRVNNQLMDLFGAGGIQSIDGVYYSISADKNDTFVKPSIGMFKRAESEHPGIKFNKGWYVGNSVVDMKAAFKIGSRGILINPNEEELKKLNSFSNQKIKKKTRVFQSLLDFSQTLK
jgi:histidinol phosphatase-like enzyme